MRSRPGGSLVLGAALAGIALVALPGATSAAQQAAEVPAIPMRVVRFQGPVPEVPAALRTPVRAPRAQEEAEASVIRVVGWSLLGSAIGAAAGAGAGAALLDDDTELAGLEGAFVGAPFGAAVGAGLGAHLGSRRRGSAVLTVLAPVAMVALVAGLSDEEWHPVIAATLTVPLAVLLETVGPRPG